MKKIFFSLIAILMFTVSGWASDMTSDNSTSETAIYAQETTESSSEPSPATETPAAESDTASAAGIAQEPPKHGFGHKLLFYIPNRILDVFDFLRLRVRVGPGLALGARVTKPLSVFVGGYGSIYVGLPGPRLEPTVKLPIGIENYGGIGVSFLDTTSEGRFAPNYSPTEIGASFQLLLLGADIDVDPFEVLDLATGFLFIDLRGDDL